MDISVKKNLSTSTNFDHMRAMMKRQKEKRVTRVEIEEVQICRGTVYHENC